MAWIVKISIHQGSISQKRFDKLTVADEPNEIIIENTKGETLQIPIEYLEIYSNCPERIFNKLMNVVSKDRELVITYKEESGERKSVRVNDEQKSIFVKNEDDEILFPEMKHNDYQELDGHITRGNESANTIGFLYSGHILTCYPDERNIKEYKEALFLNCRIKGFVDRTDKEGNITEKRPKIRFVSLEIVDDNRRQTNLFGSKK